MTEVQELFSFSQNDLRNSYLPKSMKQTFQYLFGSISKQVFSDPFSL
ncbi:unnamed protein product [Paramecium sonneborni]|uniref:Uncharacterized protein n=1 Tax=Paramecium sonneborni TaxID=65129 RepID=A0A8S1RV49_9CILI|nr:unnamed protein product [Paramecium sonneborni]